MTMKKQLEKEEKYGMEEIGKRRGRIRRNVKNNSKEGKEGKES